MVKGHKVQNTTTTINTKFNNFSTTSTENVSSFETISVGSALLWDIRQRTVSIPFRRFAKPYR